MTDQVPMRLREAAARFGEPLSRLRVAGEVGKLRIFRLDENKQGPWYTTGQDIQEWRTGSRSKNILGLRWPQVRLDSGILLRRDSDELERHTKRAPPVRMGKRLVSHMWRWSRRDAGHSEHVIHFEGRPISRINKANGAFKRAAHGAGLGPEVTPHTLRHTAATWLMQRGVSIWEASGFLGMSPEVLTKRYGHHSPDFQKNAAEALSRK